MTSYNVCYTKLLRSGVEVVGLDQFPEAPEVVEDGDTFEANARKKALEMAQFSGYLTLADDSGLTVARNNFV